MQTVEIGADTKLCRDISRLFKDYLVRYEISDLFLLTCGVALRKYDEKMQRV